MPDLKRGPCPMKIARSAATPAATPTRLILYLPLPTSNVLLKLSFVFQISHTEGICQSWSLAGFGDWQRNQF
jgi:hypothetical protein